MSRHLCQHATRREFLGAGLVGALGLGLSPLFDRLLAAEGRTRKAKACILVWLNGGPSHVDTFDPKPGIETGGPFKAIDSAVAGLQLSEHLPKLAAQAKQLAVVRSLTSREQDHERAYQYLHTGNVGDESVEYPALGAVVASEWQAEDGDLPSFIALNGGAAGPGFLGVDFAAHVVGDLNAPVANIALPEGVDEKRLARRLKALRTLDDGFARRADKVAAEEHRRLTERAARFRISPALKAFDLSAEKPATLAAYGADKEEAIFARSCVMARRLIEKGVRFVEVTLDGWDTHADNFNQVRELSHQLDPALAALVADLAERGLLKETLLVCLGEFGRTPQINQDQGRDHWSDAFSAVVAGGGVRGGQVLGASDERGEKVKERPVTVPDLYATLLSAFGLDAGKVYHTPAGRPVRLADKGKLVEELFA